MIAIILICLIHPSQHKIGNQIDRGGTEYIDVFGPVWRAIEGVQQSGVPIAETVDAALKQSHHTARRD